MRSEEHTSELQSRQYLPSSPTRPSSNPTAVRVDRELPGPAGRLTARLGTRSDRDAGGAQVERMQCVTVVGEAPRRYLRGAAMTTLVAERDRLAADEIGRAHV